MTRRTAQFERGDVVREVGGAPAPMMTAMEVYQDTIHTLHHDPDNRAVRQTFRRSQLYVVPEHERVAELLVLDDEEGFEEGL